MDGIREELTDGTIDWEKEQKKAENDPSLPIFVHYRRGITRSSGDSTKYCFCSECQDGISTLYVICDRNSALATCAESFLWKITPCHRYLSLLSSYSHAVPFAIRSPILPLSLPLTVRCSSTISLPGHVPIAASQYGIRPLQPPQHCFAQLRPCFRSMLCS